MINKLSIHNIMILRRLGNKSKIAKEIQQYFPKHKIYIEPFFGAGGMFFNKPKAKYNIVNDIDSDVFNLFQVVSNNHIDLLNYFNSIPIHQDLWAYWLKNEETDAIKKAARFLFLSNYGYMGKPNTLAFGIENFKNNFDLLLNKTNELLFNVQFGNQDCIAFINNLKRIKEDDKPETFVYCDPPYIQTDNNYSNFFKKDDFIKLIESLDELKFNYAISEFDNEFIMQQAKERKLNVHIIGERRNLKNRRTEILITNYEVVKGLFG